MSTIPCVLTIAGTDPSGGAGIQADLKTFQELRSYGMSVITSIVAQNTTGVQDIHHLPLSMIESQLDSVLEDIPPQALKTGMIANIDMMKIIKQKIQDLNVPYIMDPVMVATSGDALIDDKARDFLSKELISLTTVITPNIPEAEYLLNEKIENIYEMEMAAEKIVKEFGAKAVLVTGGHLKGDAVDVLYDGDRISKFPSQRINTSNTHGTGCTLSAAITAYLGQGLDLIDSISQSKRYVSLAIEHSLDLGKGSGPTNHWAPRVKDR